jgi:hypothetical protein
VLRSRWSRPQVQHHQFASRFDSGREVFSLPNLKCARECRGAASLSQRVVCAGAISVQPESCKTTRHSSWIALTSSLFLRHHQHAFLCRPRYPQARIHASSPCKALSAVQRLRLSPNSPITPILSSSVEQMCHTLWPRSSVSLETR